MQWSCQPLLPATAFNRWNPADNGEVSSAHSTCPVWPVVCCWYSAYCRHPSLTWLPAPNQVVCPGLTYGAAQCSQQYSSTDGQPGGAGGGPPQPPAGTVHNSGTSHSLLTTLQDEVVKEALASGQDLREYSRQVEQQLAMAEQVLTTVKLDCTRYHDVLLEMGPIIPKLKDLCQSLSHRILYENI